MMTVEECVYWIWLLGQQRASGQRNVYDELTATVARDVDALRRLSKKSFRDARYRYDDYCPPFWQWDASLAMFCRAAIRAIERERAGRGG